MEVGGAVRAAPPGSASSKTPKSRSRAERAVVSAAARRARGEKLMGGRSMETSTGGALAVTPRRGRTPGEHRAPGRGSNRAARYGSKAGVKP